MDSEDDAQAGGAASAVLHVGYQIASELAPVGFSNRARSPSTV